VSAASHLGLAFHLQQQFPVYCVDVEYNRKGADAKRLAIPEECANAFDHLGRALVVPDIIVHRRGPDGPNLLGLELKKIDDPRGPGCDRQRIRALKEQLQYEFGALVECETRLERGTFIRMAESMRQARARRVKRIDEGGDEATAQIG
jgi:hypothetical protein